MCTVLLPLGDNPIAVNKYIISYHISYNLSYHIISYHKYTFGLCGQTENEIMKAIIIDINGLMFISIHYKVSNTINFAL